MEQGGTDGRRIVDASQIQGLLDAAGREGVAAIMEAFWRSTDNLIASIKDQADRDDLDGVATTSHALKGSAANVGAHLLADAARQLEAAVKSGKRGDVSDNIETVAAAYGETRGAFDQILGDAA